jgi:hypothetical protein
MMPPIMRRLPAFKVTVIFLMCAASAAGGGASRPETFVIHTSEGGREATVKIPVGAVSACSANAAEALVNYADPQVEAMRLRGNVRIDVIGAGQPIEIQADSVVLELTADHKRAENETAASGARADPRRPPARVITVQTSAGEMQITADRVEHTAGAAAEI